MPATHDQPDPQLVNAIRRLRRERRMSQEAVAREADLSTSAYAKIERGVTSPAWVTVRQVAAAFDLTISEFAAEVDRDTTSSGPDCER